MPRQKKGKRGSIINKWGVKITKKEQEEINRLKRQIDQVRKKLQDKLDRDQELRQDIKIDKSKISGKKKPKIKNKFQEDYENFHLDNPILPNRRSANKNQFKNKGLMKAWIKTAKDILKDPYAYLDKKMAQFQQNYLDSILNNFTNGLPSQDDDAYKELTGNVKALYDKVKGMSPQEFYDAYLNGEIPTINENYIPSDEYPRYIEETYGITDTKQPKGQGDVQMKFDKYGNPIND